MTFILSNVNITSAGYKIYLQWTSLKCHSDMSVKCNINIPVHYNASHQHACLLPLKVIYFCPVIRPACERSRFVYSDPSISICPEKISWRTALHPAVTLWSRWAIAINTILGLKHNGNTCIMWLKSKFMNMLRVNRLNRSVINNATWMQLLYFKSNYMLEEKWMFIY